MKNITKTGIVFLLANFLFLTPALTQPSNIQLKVVAEQANIRLKPDITSLIIYQAPLGSYLSLLEKEGEWYKVDFVSDEGEEGSGYVHESLVIMLEPEIDEEKKPEKTKKPVEIPEEKIKETDTPTKETQIVRPEKRSSVHLPAEFPPVQFALTGGGNILGSGDLNRGSEGLAGFYKDSLGATTEGTVSPLRLSYNFGAELNMALSPQISLGIGFDYLKGEKESRIELSKGTRKDIYTTRPEIRAFPLRFSFIYSPVTFFYLKAGFDYY
ncbi:MAG: SH3 domain-containing protein, partial [Acidobacteriota bacterium]